MNERQKHGFLYEEFIINKYHLKKEENYLSKYDAYYYSTPVQIKYIKFGNPIDFGSYSRNLSTSENFFLFIGFWGHETGKGLITKQYILYIKSDVFNTFFISPTDFNVLSEKLKTISNNVSDDENCKELIRESKSMGKDKIFKIRIKRDHLRQKRIQCSISTKNFGIFCEMFKHFVYTEPQELNLTKSTRNIKEQYYTDATVASRLVQKTHELVGLHNFRTIIEPSAGTGVFLDVLSSKVAPTTTIVAYDIDPKHPDIKQQDFLSLVADNLIASDTLIIGNPPFGRQSSLAKKFISKSCSIADTIAFILPKSFKKQSMNKCFGEYFHLIHQEDIEKNSFVFNETQYDVPCVFQIWKRGQDKRYLDTIQKENGRYSIVKKHDNPTIAFRRAGASAGKFFFDSDLSKYSEQSNIFIKCSLSDTETQALLNLRWTHNNTVGPKSVSKNELIKALNGVLSQ